VFDKNPGIHEDVLVLMVINKKDEKTWIKVNIFPHTFIYGI
jgi:hypothetical protein